MILDHARSPYHRGRLAGATVAHVGRNAACGDWVGLQLRMEPDGRVAEAWFQGVGCVLSQAAASILCEEIEGQTIAQLQDFTPQHMLNLLEIPLTPRRYDCALLALGVLKAIVDARRPGG